MPRTFSATSALTWENHDCLFNTSGIWVLLTCPLKAERVVQSTRGFGTQSRPSPVPWLSPAAPRSGLCTPTQCARVGEADSILTAVCCCSCWGHSPLHAAYYIRVLSGGHWAGPLWRPKRFLSEVAYWEILL